MTYRARCETRSNINRAHTAFPASQSGCGSVHRRARATAGVAYQILGRVSLVSLADRGPTPALHARGFTKFQYVWGLRFAVRAVLLTLKRALAQPSLLRFGQCRIGLMRRHCP